MRDRIKKVLENRKRDELEERDFLLLLRYRIEIEILNEMKYDPPTL